jgi:type VI secretion system protein
MESVRLNLERIINARQGMSECLPDYGLPALSDLIVGVNDYVQIMRDAIQTAIENYEPRLRNVRVSRVQDEDGGRTLAFRVDAVLVARSGEHRVWYETSITGDGQFDVTG